MHTSTSDEIRTAVQQAYGAVARGSGGCCGGGSGAGGGCGPVPQSSRQLGYSEAQLASVPDGADLGLGCGNPHAIAALAPGERVLDLGSGAGFDAFLAARQVGPTGRVIGVDMTPEMVGRARANAVKTGLRQVEFRLGDIERLPVDDGSIDVILSNCVINLVPDKAAVFAEAYRVLAPGGRLAISDVVAIDTLPSTIAADPTAYTACVAGAASVGDIERIAADAGFRDVRVDVRTESRSVIAAWQPGSGAERFVASAQISATKPASTSDADNVASRSAEPARVGQNQWRAADAESRASGAAPSSSTGIGEKASACCESSHLERCCAPQDKPTCCGTSPDVASSVDVTAAAPAATCGCQAKQA